MTIQPIIHPELQAYMSPLSAEELAQLTANLQAHGYCDALVIWQEEHVILDGHHRFDICQQYDIPYDIRSISLPDLDAAKAWMIANQLGRRNFTSDAMSYWRGKQYELQKQRHGGDRKSEEKSKGNFCPLKNDEPRSADTAQILAKEHQVSSKTIKNDAAYARDVDAVATAVGPKARQAILARDTKVGRQEVKKLAIISKASPQTARHLLEEVKTAATPKVAKQLIYEVAKDLPVPDAPEVVTPPMLILDIEEPQPRRGLETIALDDGRDMFIMHNPDSKPVFNTQTTESIDWATWSWNPVTGCWHGCDYCYARAIANNKEFASAFPKQFEPTFHPSRLEAPKNTPYPKELRSPVDKNVFVCSMADLFGKWIPEDWIMQVFERVKIHPEWNFLFLTKFPQRLQEICDALNGFPDNAWVGCTVDAQARVATAERAFKAIRAPVRWLSVEPMRERLTFKKLDMFDWVVMGGQTASRFNNTPDVQPEWEWVEHLWQQARDAGVKIYWKKNLTVRPKETPWDSAP